MEMLTGVNIQLAHMKPNNIRNTKQNKITQDETEIKTTKLNLSHFSH